MNSTLNLALGLASELMKKIPNYNQRKKEKFYDLKKEWMDEDAKKHEDRDIGRLIYLERELCVFLESFYTEIRS